MSIWVNQHENIILYSQLYTFTLSPNEELEHFMKRNFKYVRNQVAEIALTKIEAISVAQAICIIYLYI